jgi:hypothetical protein
MLSRNLVRLIHSHIERVLRAVAAALKREIETRLALGGRVDGGRKVCVHSIEELYKMQNGGERERDRQSERQV